MIEPQKIIVRSIVTEKSERIRENHNQYTFRVKKEVNKIQIRKAVEKLFNVKVEKVRVMNFLGKPKRMGVFLGKRSDWKKAVVTLKKGEKIESLGRT
ncbi:MAG: 50S ribosomal protein L23 [candidate division WOR-3 bacterium]|nr:50S ribosomal protein L23 [candidate division WOR-3 bacterium]MDH5683518.1 50S ribosomal protein L23 [candidate division WOR-3 bacterium]